MAADPRAAALHQVVRNLAPKIPQKDAAAVVDHALWSKGLRRGTPEAAAWLSLVAYIRHSFTEYDALLADGYGVEAARHFTLGAINAVLAEWGARRRLDRAEDGEDGED